MNSSSSKWIKLSERLPEHRQDVLISDGSSIGAASADLQSFKPKVWWDGCGFGGYEWEWDFEPTHWMPLPELPKADDVST